MALLAGLAARSGLNSAVAIVCVAIAMIGTWVLLSPRIEMLEPAITTAGTQAGGSGSGAVSTVSAFAGQPESGPRQGLRGAPRAAVGFDTPSAERPGTPQPAHLPSIGGDAHVDSVAPVHALGQLPLDASALQVSTTVEPPSNVSGAYTLGQFEVRASSRRGSDHVILNDLRQDDYVVASAAGGRYLVVVVADGDGGAENAHYGSYWSSRLLARSIDQHLRDGVPGIENMLERTREELQQLFDLRFTDGTKLRTIATTMVGLIAPVDGGPAAGFRVGDGDLLIAGADGWTSVFGPATGDADAVFPRTIQADVEPLDLDTNCLLLVADGVAGPISAHADVASSFSEGLQTPVSEVEFDQLMSFPLEDARGDRTAVGIWFTPK